MTWFPLRLMTQVVNSDRCIFVKRARHVYVTEKLQLWSTTRQPCCWVAWVMPWDTGTSCGSTMSLGQPSIRWSWLQCAVIMRVLFSSILKDKHLFGLCRSLKSWAACRTSRLSSLIGRWATTRFCIWRRLKGWQPVSSMRQRTRLASLASVTLLLF